MNIEKRFWPIDDTDINRMFPEYIKGETTQRIVSGLFEQVKGYSYGILKKYTVHSGYIASILDEEDLLSAKTDKAGIYKRIKNPGDWVERGDVIGEILDPYEGEVISQVKAPTDGIIFFAYNSPMIMENVVAYKIIRRLHQ